MPQDIPCCRGCCGNLVGYIRRVHIHSPSRSSSGWGHTDHSCGQLRLACRGIGQSVYHSDTLHQYSSHLQCPQLHKYSLQDETECKITHKCIHSLPLLIVNAIRFWNFRVTVLTPTVLSKCVSIITWFTLRTRVAVCVVQALEALAGSWVTWLWVLGVNVPIAMARLACPARQLRIPIVQRGTAITART